MPIAVTCPQCARRHSAPDSLAGRQAKCGCGAVLAVPAQTVLPVPAQAVAAPAAPRPAVPKPAARPSGSWQAQTAAPAVTVPAGPSVFDDISPADLSRGKKPAAAAPLPLCESTALTPAGTVTSDFIERAKSQLAERERTEYERLPYSVTMVVACLGVPGGIALFAAFGSLVLLGADLLEDFGSEFLIFLFVMGAMLAALDITAAALVYLRIPFSRVLGYIATGVTLLTGCVNPINFICAVIAFWFLSMPETGDYLRRKGAPGVIDW